MIFQLRFERMEEMDMWYGFGFGSGVFMIIMTTIMVVGPVEARVLPFWGHVLFLAFSCCFTGATLYLLIDVATTENDEEEEDDDGKVIV